MTKISELQVGQGKVSVAATVKEMGEVRNINKFGREIRVANATIADESGEIKLTLWNDDIDKVKPGSKVKITNGYVNEFNGEKQLTAGKFGSMEVGGGGGGENAEPNEKTEEEQEELAEEPEKVEEEY